jgi:hypothetical protein
MNYALDRADRKALGTDLWEEFVSGLQNGDSGKLGRSLRDVGWNRHAVFHFSQRISESDDTMEAVADYAQMAEFSGYPELGVLSLLHYRNRGEFEKSSKRTLISSPVDDPSWLQQNCPPEGHCGCGFEECGSSACIVPMKDVHPVLNALCTYVRNLPTRKMPTAHHILTALSKNEYIPCSDDIPELLKFWKLDSPNFRPLSSVSQLLLLKQLYLFLPTLAIEALVQIRVDERQMAKEFKSHNAYHVLMKAVILGRRIKPSREKSLKHIHIPVWNALWGHDARHQQILRWQPSVEDFNDHLISCLFQCSTKLKGPKWFVSSNFHLPLFIVGDSHILSAAWQTIRLPDGSYRTLVPILVTGLKAWHCRRASKFFTHSLWLILLERMLLSVNNSWFVISAGEIDCREGLGGPQLEGYVSLDEHHVFRTVLDFLSAIQTLQLPIAVLPVCPHIHRANKNGKVNGRKARRYATQLWNNYLRELLPLDNIRFLDYESDIAILDPSNYVLHPDFNADGTHMNSAFLPYLESALLKELGDAETI